MDGMDIDDLRRKNLRRLEAEYGGAAAFAKVVGMSDAQYLNLRNGAKDSRTEKRRGMRKATAWRFEDAAKKPRGWLDQDHDRKESMSLNALEVGLIEMFRRLPENFRDALLQDANKYLVLCEPSQSAHNPFPAVTTLLKKVKQ